VPLNQVPLLGGTYRLDNDLFVRLRMARSSDILPIRRFVERHRATGEVELSPLVQFDPRRRCVICATALIDSAETLVGVGAIELDGDRDTEPDLLIVADELAAELAALLAGALIERAARAGQARAA
jgi:hypothetical protein